MKITIENTDKVIQLNGVNGVPARIWEGETESGIKVHCFITRIAISEDEPKEVQERFSKELSETRKPRPEFEVYDARLIL